MLCFSRAAVLLAAFSLPLYASVARADDDAGTPLTKLDEPTWHARYMQAAAKLANQEYGEAITLLSELVATAPDEADQKLALAQIKIAADLAHGTVATPPPVTRPPPPPPSEPPPEPAPEPSTYPTQPPRSLDELIWTYANSLSYGFVSGLFIDGAAHENRSLNSEAPLAVGFPVTTAATVGVIALVDSMGKFRYGVPQSITTGMYLGLEQGLYWVMFDTGMISKNGGSSSFLRAASIIWGPTTAGALTGGLVGGFTKMTPGEASWIGSMALWPALILGSATGAATSSSSTNGSDVPINMGAVAGVTSLVGMVVGGLTAPLVEPSIARPRFIDLGSFLGRGAGFAIALVSSLNCGYGNCTSTASFAGFSVGTGLGFIAMIPITGLLEKDPVASHFAAAVAKARPMLMPVQGGLTLGFGGTL